MARGSSDQRLVDPGPRKEKLLQAVRDAAWGRVSMVCSKLLSSRQRAMVHAKSGRHYLVARVHDPFLHARTHSWLRVVGLRCHVRISLFVDCGVDPRRKVGERLIRDQKGSRETGVLGFTAEELGQKKKGGGGASTGPGAERERANMGKQGAKDAYQFPEVLANQVIFCHGSFGPTETMRMRLAGRC